MARGVRGLEKYSMRCSSSPQPTVRFEPTYRVEPVRPFRLDRAAAMVRSALETGLADATYSEQWAADACRILAAYITQCVKSLETPRSISLSIGLKTFIFWERSEMAVAASPPFFLVPGERSPAEPRCSN